jgi:hypothetical protein
MAEMLQLRAWLVDSKPEIWRRVLVDPRFTLQQLHTVLQHAFGWTDSHLHEFHEKDGRRYATPSREDWGDPVIDERKVSLGDVFHRAKRKIAYEYDFGDSWIHAIELEKRVDSEKVDYPFETFVKEGKGYFSGKPRAAICIAGEKSGPPEDCGGLYGFYELLEIKQKPAAKRSDDEHERLEWLGDEWDFDRCDLSEINQMLGKMRVKKAMMGE